MKFFIKDFFSKCDQTRRKLFCAVSGLQKHEFSMLVCFDFMFAHIYAFLCVQIARKFENRIPKV